MTGSIEVTATGARMCSTCGRHVIDTDVGYTHLDQSGALAGWLCPTPHDGLAQPMPIRRITTIPRRRPPDITQSVPPRLNPRSP